MKARAVLTYSQFKELIPKPFLSKRDLKMTAFRKSVGEQVTRFRNYHMPATNTVEDRQSRWLAWIKDVDFDEGWSTIEKIDDDLINEMAQGKRSVEFAAAVYYRLHAELQHTDYAEAIDLMVFGETLLSRGTIVFLAEYSDQPTEEPGGRQPRLAINITAATNETRFLFRSRAIPYQEPEEAFAALDNVLADPAKSRPFVWHVLYGPGGSGKSRLALEYALHRRDATGEAIGFLDLQQARSFDWAGWQPDRPTIMIVDYAAREAELIGIILRSLSARDDLEKPVRLLMLERDMTASWFNRATMRGSSFASQIEQSWSGEDGLVDPPTDLWPIIVFIAASRVESLPSRDKVFGELERIDPQCRPLYAAFLTDAYARGEDPRRWDAYALVENVLQREKRFWKEGGANSEHINLSICATFAGGVPNEWLELQARDDLRDFWPSRYDQNTFEALSAIFGFPLAHDIPPLEPDILGEVFVLEYWAHATNWEKARFLHFAELMAPWFAEFLDRALSDFPTRTAVHLLQTALHLDFAEYANKKPELIYNAVHALAHDYPETALDAFWMFEGLTEQKLADNLAECLIDSVFNLFIALPDLELRGALDCHILQRELDDALTNRLPEAQARSEVCATLLAKYPKEEAELFRTVLADAVWVYRSFPDDPKIIRETALSIHFYVDKLREHHFEHALFWLRAFERIAARTGDSDVKDALEDIRFHVLLLGIEREPKDVDIEVTASHVFSRLQKLVPIPSSFFDVLQNRLQSELLEQ